MDDLGDRMKAYEGEEAKRVLDPSLPIIIRLDGRAFHSFTKGLQRPFDSNLTECMKRTSMFLMDQFNAELAYTQSDEITLVILTKGTPMFSARIQKLCSLSASAATVAFNQAVRELLPPKFAMKMPMFDARVWNVPNLIEAANVLVWREFDAEKNSIAMMAQANFSHKVLQGVNGVGMKDMLAKLGKPWEDLSSKFQRGMHFKRVKRLMKLTEQELNAIPLSKQQPDAEYLRCIIERVKMPPLRFVADKAGLLFDNWLLVQEQKERVVLKV